MATTRVTLNINWMNTEVSLTTDKRAWIVGAKADAELLASKSTGVGLLTLSNDATLTKWESKHEVGDWDALGSLIKGVEVVIALPASVAVTSNGKKLIRELEDRLENGYGARVTTLSLEPGQTFADLFEEYQPATPKALLEAIQATSDALGGGTTQTTQSTPADVLYDIAYAQFEFHRDKDKVPFLVLKDGHKLAWQLENGAEPNLRAYLTSEFLRTVRQVPSGASVRDAIDAISATCALAPAIDTLSLRQAKDAHGTSWIDLGDDEGNVVEIKPGHDWIVRKSPGENIYFKRSSTIHPLPVPQRVSSGDARIRLNELMRPLVNVADEDWPLLVAWMVTHLMPGAIAPICLLISESDAGKSTATQAIRYSVEGHLTKGSTLNNKIDDLAVTMSGERISVFNNVSKITKELSDFFCEVIDGTERKKRKLTTDAAVALIKVDSSILINGITTGELRGDFKTRSIKLELRGITSGRKTNEEIERHLVSNHPEVLGSLLTIVSQIVTALPHTDLPKPEPRMIDYARVLATLDRVWGLDGATTKRYSASLDSMSLEALDDPLFVAVHKLCVNVHTEQEDGTYIARVSAEEIMVAVNEVRSDARIKAFGLKEEDEKAGFTRSVQVGVALRKLSPDWKRLGVTMERLGQQGKGEARGSYYSFTFTPSADGETPWDTIPRTYASTDDM